MKRTLLSSHAEQCVRDLPVRVLSTHRSIREQKLQLMFKLRRCVLSLLDEPDAGVGALGFGGSS